MFCIRVRNQIFSSLEIVLLLLLTVVQTCENNLQKYKVGCPDLAGMKCKMIQCWFLIGTLDSDKNEWFVWRVCRYNPRSLGIKKIRKVHMSRGGKEGNNAFTKVGETKYRWNIYGKPGTALCIKKHRS